MCSAKGLYRMCKGTKRSEGWSTRTSVLRKMTFVLQGGTLVLQRQRLLSRQRWFSEFWALRFSSVVKGGYRGLGFSGVNEGSGTLKCGGYSSGSW